MFRKIVFTSLLCFFITSSLVSQEVYSYARKIVDTLASESMHGRGYVNGGDSIAANYIQTEFKKFGLKSFTENYYQKFSFPINTFPSRIFLAIDYFPGAWITGANYLVSPSSPTMIYKKNNRVVWFDSATVSSSEKTQAFSKTNFKKKWIIIDSYGVKDKEQLKLFDFMKTNPFNAFGIAIINDKKLTWDCSQKVDKFPTIELLLNDTLRKGLNKNQKSYIGFQVDNKFIPNHPTQNVIGYIQGSEFPDSFIVYSAHYDHLGQMGADVYFPGANDNASGSAMLLNLAKYYSQPENKPKYSIAFMSFCGEEVGLLGSKYYTEHPLFPLNQIKFLLNLDIMGTGEDGITVVNGTIFKTEFDQLKKINTDNKFIKDVFIRGKAANSDHYLFSEKGVKAFFIYTMGGIKAYHDIYDRPETLPLNEFENLFKLITSFNKYLQN